MPTTRLVPLSLIVILGLAVGPGCKNEEKEREALRAELDAEFEQDTERLLEHAGELETLIEELVAEHQRLDNRHDYLDEQLKGKKLSAEDQELQKKHETWDEEHRAKIDKAKATIADFEKAHEAHEEAEKGHADVPLDQIREEHEEFEKELLAFRQKLMDTEEELRAAAEQMDQIFADHQEMAKRYGVEAQ